MLLFAIDLIVFLSLAAQFAIAGYFLYLVYWLIELPAADAVPPGRRCASLSSSLRFT